MKKFFAIIVAVTFAFTTFFTIAHAEIYPQVFMITDVIEESDTLTLMDFNGNAWEMKGIEDYMIGDMVAAIMNDNDTEIIYDDEIIMIQFVNYVEDWE